MSINNLIIFQLVFFLIVSWVFALIIIRKLRNTNSEQAELIRNLYKGKRYKALSTVSSDANSSSTVDEESINEMDFSKTENVNSVFNDMDRENEHNVNDMKELDTILKEQSASISRLRKMREAMENKEKQTVDSSLNKELSFLKKKNKDSEIIIKGLNDRLEKNRHRMNAIQKKLAKTMDFGDEVVRLEKENKRLSVGRYKAEQKLKKEMQKHQNVISSIQERLSAAEKRSSESILKAKMREDSLIGTITDLQDKLQEDSSDERTTEELDILKKELNAAQEALNQVVNEKEFLENNFVDLEKALQESVSAKEELERTKKEYQMLENHFLALEEEIEQESDLLNDGIPEKEKDIEELNPVEVATNSGADDV